VAAFLKIEKNLNIGPIKTHFIIIIYSLSQHQTDFNID